MTTETLIKKLNEALRDNIGDALVLIQNFIKDTIKDESKEPFDQISQVIRKVEFDDICDINKSILLLQTLIKEMSDACPKKAVLILNDIKITNIEFTMGDIIEIVSKFTKSELLTKLGELYEEDKRYLRLADDEKVHELLKEVEKLKIELQQKKEENYELKKQIEELKDQNRALQEKFPKFPPITEKPKDFEKNVFNACAEGKLDSVQYHFEVLHADKEATCEREIPHYGISSGLTALNTACNSGQLQIVQYLCEVQNVNKETTNSNGFTPLLTACNSGYLPIVQ